MALVCSAIPTAPAGFRRHTRRGAVRISRQRSGADRQRHALSMTTIRLSTTSSFGSFLPFSHREILP